jgi:large subunit ribosomal protein L30
MADTKTIKITLTKSIIGAQPRQRKTIEALGLRKMHQTVELEDTPATRGAIMKVAHLVTVSEA